MRSNYFWFAFLWTFVAQAEPLKTSGGKAYDVAPEVRARYEKLRSAARVPPRSNSEAMVGSLPELQAEGVLRAYDDGALLLEVELSPEVQAMLEAQGARRVQPGQQDHHTLLGALYTRRYRVADPAHVLAGPDPAELQRRVGQKVVLTLKATASDRYWVTAVRSAR